MGRLETCIAIVIVLTSASLARADTPDEGNGRFTMSPVDGGFLRLDKQSGAVSMCAKSGADWACKPVEDRAPAASSSEISKLEDENRVLKKRIKDLEDSVESGKTLVPPPPGPPGGKIELPTDEQVDQALDYLERMYKKLRDRIKDLDKPGMPPPPPAADASPQPKRSL